MTRIPPILVVLVFGALAAASIMQVRFSSELYALLPPDLPEVKGMQQLDTFFGRSGQLIVTVEAEAPWAAREAGASLAEALRTEDELVAAVFRELELEELVTEGGELLAWAWLNAPPERLAGLAERLHPGQSESVIADSMAIVQDAFQDEKAFVAGYDPLGLARVADEGTARPDTMRSADGTFEVLYLEGRGIDFSDYRAAGVWLGTIRAVVERWRSGWLAAQGEEAAVTIGLTGTPAFMAEVGAEMEKDMAISVLVTLLLIALLFHLMHRQSRPLSWLVAAMFAILAVTLNVGAVLYGELSVMSVGFAAILMGLAVDYGIVLYREAMQSRGSTRDLRRSVGTAIVWAALTTAVVFLSLNLSALPGLGQMGNLVAIGVAVGALVMLFGFAPVAVRFGREASQVASRALPAAGLAGRCAGWIAIGVPVVAVLSVLLGDAPGLAANFHPFRMRESPSIQAWQQMQERLRGEDVAVPAVVTAGSAAELQERLEGFAMRVEAADAEGLVARSTIPRDWIPNPARQRRNADVIRGLLPEGERLMSEIEAAGFSSEGAALTTAVFDAWRDFEEQLATAPFALPQGRFAAWSLGRVFRAEDGRLAALATVLPANPTDRAWVEAICADHAVVASLGSLGTALNERIRGDLRGVFLPMMGLLSIVLGLVFRCWRDLLLSLFALLFAAGVLVILTVWTPLAWNSFNVCGLPLLFGTGLDFGIHMIFALRRSGGDIAAAHRGIGRALLFCGASSAIGFGSLATASAHGLSSLGVVCATGILVNMVVAVWLLPVWYRRIHRLPD